MRPKRFDAACCSRLKMTSNTRSFTPPGGRKAGRASANCRTPTVFLFNSFAEGYIAQGKAFTPVKHQVQLGRDLANLPQFLGRQDDIVLIEERPGAKFLGELKEAGLALPEFVEIPGSRI